MSARQIILLLKGRPLLRKRRVSLDKNIKTPLRRRRFLLVTLSAIILLSSIASTGFGALLPTQKASAVSSCSLNSGIWSAPANSKNCLVAGYTPEEEVTSLSYYAALSDCIGNRMHATMQLNVSDNGIWQPKDWFDNGTFLSIGDEYKSVDVYPDGDTACADIVTEAMTLWGYGSDVVGFLKAIGYTYNKTTAVWSEGSGGDSKRTPNFDAAISANVYNGFTSSLPPLSNAAKYIESLHFFEAPVCAAQDLGIYPALGGVKGYKAYVDKNYNVASSDPAAGNAAIVKADGGQNGYITYTNVTIVNDKKVKEPHGYVYMSSLVDASQNQPLEQSIYSKQSVGSKQYSETCTQLAKDITTYSSAYIAWLAINTAAVVTTPDQPQCTATPKPAGCGGAAPETCVLGNVGWIVCPIINFMATANDGLYGILSSLLVVDTGIVSTNSPTYNAWQAIRSVANVGLVIAFLIIIFSQISSFGIGNYGVKKMLPRLIIAAILINMSFLVCQIAVDLSNIIGASISPFFSNITVFGKPAGALSTASIAGTILAGGIGLGAIAAGVTAAVIAGSLLIPVLMAALLAVLVTVLILAGRKVVIILLVVLAPLAFLAMLLPGTEGLFKQWRKILIAMLIVYPEVGLLFAGSTLASNIITASSTDALEQIIGIVVTFVPLLLTPMLLQGSLKAVPMLGNFASSLAKRANSNVSKSANKRLKPELDKYLSRRDAGLQWNGKKRVARSFRGGYKRDKDGAIKMKDGKPVRQRFFGAKADITTTTKRNRKNGQFAPGSTTTTEATTNDARVRNFGAVLGQRGMGTEKELSANKALSEANYGKNSLRTGADGDKSNITGRAARRVADRSASTGVEQQAVDEIYKSRLKARQFQHGSADSRAFHQLEDAEASSKAFDARLKEQQLGRVQGNAVNTAAGAIGIAGENVVLNIGHGATAGTTSANLGTLGGLSQIEAASNARSEATELQIQRANKESGVMAGAIQQKKEAEAGIKAYDTKQDEYFKTRQAREAPLRQVVEQQDAAERGIKTLDKEQEARLEKVAHSNDALRKLQQRENRATIEVENLHLDEKNEMEASRLAGGVNADLTAAAIESQSEADRIAAELKKTQQEAGFGKDQIGPDGKSLFGGVNTGNRTPEQVAADAQARLDRIKANKKSALADSYAGNWAEGGTSLELDKEIAEDQQGELARRAAGTRIKLKTGPDGKPIELKDEKGNVRKDSNGQIMYEVEGNENVVARAFQRLQADTQGDADALKAQYEREGFNSGTLFEKVLGVDSSTAEGPVKEDIPIAEEVAAIQRVAESGDIGGGTAITEYVATLSQRADAFEEKAAAYEKTDTSPAAVSARNEAVAARQRSKLVANGMMNGFAKNSKGKPPWAGGSDEAKWIEGRHSDGPKQQVVNAFGGGKLSGDKLMNSNYEQLRPMNKFFDEVAQPGGVEAAIATAKSNVSKDDFPPGTPERAAEETRVEQEFKDNFAQTLLTLDDLLDNPKYANRLETRQRNELEKTRATFDGILEQPGAPIQPPEMKDPRTGKPIPYRRRTPEEYYTTPRPDQETS